MDRGQKRAQLRTRLLELVQQNENGGRLPTERALSERFDMARETVRRCLKDLENEGLLERKQGIGTFVAARPVVKEARLMSFSEEMRQRGLTPSSKLLSASTILAGAKLAQRLKLSPGSVILEMRRLRLANDEPIALETSYLAQSRLPNFDPSALANGSLYALLEKQYGLDIRYASQQIQATVLNEQEAQLLRVPPFSPALVVKRTTVLNTGELIEYAKSLYRADRYRLELNVAR
jgi:GntR family transcriptional regulator